MTSYTKQLSKEECLNITAWVQKKEITTGEKSMGKRYAKCFTKVFYSSLQDEITNCLTSKC